MTKPYDILVIGGDQAGLAVHQLRRQLRAVEPTQYRQPNAARRLSGAWRCCTGREGVV